MCGLGDGKGHQNLEDIMQVAVFIDSSGATLFSGQDKKHAESLEHRLCVHYPSSLSVCIGSVAADLEMTTAVVARPRVAGLKVYWSLPQCYSYLGLKSYQGDSSEWVSKKRQGWGD